MPDFEPISIYRQEEYRAILSTSNITASDYSFINLWAWAQEYGLSWAWERGLVWIRQASPIPCMWAPVGCRAGTQWEEIFHEPGLKELLFARVPENLLSAWEKQMPGKVHAIQTRDHWDYLYAVSDLVELPGSSFHKKKNLLNQFRKRHSFSYQEITRAVIPQVLAIQEDWCAWRDCESEDMLSAENRCIKRVLDAWEDLSGITGAAIFVQDRPAAFTVAEAFSEDVLLIHFEKGMPGYTGIYQAINQMFLERNRRYAVVNREQDLGNDGLRQAKLSYNPTGFVRKYQVRIV